MSQNVDSQEVFLARCYHRSRTGRNDYRILRRRTRKVAFRDTGLSERVNRMRRQVVPHVGGGDCGKCSSDTVTREQELSVAVTELFDPFSDGPLYEFKCG